MLDVLRINLVSPLTLCFALGLFARAIRSQLALPRDLYNSLSIYLLFALGLKGGVELSHSPLAQLAAPAAVTMLLGCLTPVSAYFVLRRLGRFGIADAAGIAAHYGSVSAVTFIAAQQFTERTGAPAEGVLVALVVALEIPAILLGLALAKGGGGIDRKALAEVLTGRTAVLLLGGLAIGAIAGQKGIRAVDEMYFQLFQGTLMLFMLDMGMVAAAQLRQLRQGALRLVAFGTVVPLVHGFAGTLAGHLAGLSPSGATVFGTMVASASYIAAPASVRNALPEADAGRCVTAALGITFPFNLALGIPAYAAFSAWLVP
ncbi:MAG: sodium-dependent bicarbonate transport family permease [Pseudomonadota bacterium]